MANLKKYGGIAYPFRLQKELAVVVDKHGRQGVVDGSNKLVIKCKYDSIEEIERGVISVLQKGKWGLLNCEGEIVTPLIYDKMTKGENGIIYVEQNGKFGVINKQGKELAPCIYDTILDFENGVAVVRKDDKFGLINSEGKLVADCIYDNISSFGSSGRFTLRKGEKSFLMNKEGQEFTYGENSGLGQGYSSIKVGKTYGVMNPEGEIVCKGFDSEPEFDNKGIASVSKKGKFGAINQKGEIIVPCTQDEEIEFVDGLAKIKDDSGNDVFVNTKGGRYLNVEDIGNGYRKVQKYGGFGYFNILDKQGNPILDRHYKYLNIEGDLIVVGDSDSEKLGVFNFKGQEILECEYSELSFSENCIQAKYMWGTEPLWTAVNRSGDVIFKKYYKPADVEKVAPSTELLKYGDAEKAVVSDGYKPIKLEEGEQFEGRMGDEVYVSKPDGTRGVRTSEGLIFQCECEDLLNYSEDKAIVKRDGKVGVVNENGDIIVPFNYTKVTTEYGGYLVYKDSGCGYVNNEGEEVIPCKYDKIYFMRHMSSIAPIRAVKSKDSDFFTLLDETGKVIYEQSEICPSLGYVPGDISSPEFDQALYVVGSDDSKTVIDQSGKPILNKGYSSIEVVDPNNFVVTEKDQQGMSVIGAEDNTIIPFGKYSTIEKKYILVGENCYKASDIETSKYGILDSQGEAMIEPKYDEDQIDRLVNFLRNFESQAIYIEHSEYTFSNKEFSNIVNDDEIIEDAIKAAGAICIKKIQQARKEEDLQKIEFMQDKLGTLIKDLIERRNKIVQSRIEEQQAEKRAQKELNDAADNAISSINNILDSLSVNVSTETD